MEDFYDFQPNCVTYCNGFVVFDVYECRHEKNRENIYLFI